MSSVLICSRETWFSSVRGSNNGKLEGKLIIIPAVGLKNKVRSRLTGWSLFVLKSQCGNNNELALQYGGFCTMCSFVAKGLFYKEETASL